MAVVNVAAYNIRVEDAETTTDWINVGGGGGIALEPDIVYQGTFAASRKVGTSRIGRAFDDSTDNWDMTNPTGSTWLAKYSITNPAALLTRTAPAVTMIVGNNISDYNEYYTFGNDNYPSRGGWILQAIDPNVQEYIDNTVGGAYDSSSTAFYGIVADFSAGSKAENVVIDAIDIGLGLNLTGGDGGDPDGIFQDFVEYDQETLTNRFGYVFTQEGIIFVNGKLVIGEQTGSGNPTATTVFQDSGRVLVWNNGYFASGYAELKFNIVDPSTDIDISTCTFISRGELNNTVGLNYTSSEDTRANLILTGSNANVTFSSCAWQNWNTASLVDRSTFDACSMEFANIEQNSASIFDGTITTLSTSSIACIQLPDLNPNTGLRSTTFVQGNDGHAFALTGNGTFTLTDLNFVGYGNNTSDSASVDILATSGEVTLSLDGGGAGLTYKSAGASVLIDNPVILTLTGIQSGSEVRLLSESIELGGQESIDTGEDFTYNYTYPGFDQIVDIVIHALDYEYQLLEGVTLGNFNSSIPIQQTFDRNYENPS